MSVSCRKKKRTVARSLFIRKVCEEGGTLSALPWRPQFAFEQEIVAFDVVELDFHP